MDAYFPFLSSIIKIQSLIRGYLTRKRYLELQLDQLEDNKQILYKQKTIDIENDINEEHNKIKNLLKRSKSLEDNYSIGIENNAAIKIQSSFRGHIAREEYKKKRTSNNFKKSLLSQLSNNINNNTSNDEEFNVIKVNDKNITKSILKVESVLPETLNISKTPTISKTRVISKQELSKTEDIILDGGICKRCNENFSFAGLFYCSNNNCNTILCRGCDMIVHKSYDSKEMERHIKINVTNKLYNEKSLTKFNKSNATGFSAASLSNSNSSVSDIQLTNMCEECNTKKPNFLCSKCQLKLCVECDRIKHVGVAHKRVALPDITDISEYKTIKKFDSTLSQTNVAPSRVGSYCANGQHITFITPEIIPKHNEKVSSEIILENIFSYDSFLFQSSYFSNIVYVVGSIAVRFNPLSKSQDFFQMHTSSISSMAIHPNKKIIASAQDSTEHDLGFICIWEISTLTCLCEIHYHSSVSSLGFSSDGETLVSLGGSEDSTLEIALWNWKEKQSIKVWNLEYQAGGVIFHPYNPEIFAAYGESFLQLFNVNLEESYSILPVSLQLSSITSCCFANVSEEDIFLVIGTETGTLAMVDSKGTILKEGKNAHVEAVTCVKSIRELVLSGGHDACVNLWSFGNKATTLFGKIATFDLYQSYPSLMTSFTNIKALEITPENKLLVGTGNKQIISFDISTLITSNKFKDSKATFLLQGPTDDVSCFCTSSNNITLVGSKDSTVSVFERTNFISNIKYESKISSIDIGVNTVAIGLENGMVYLVEIGDLRSGRKGHISRGLVFSRITSNTLNYHTMHNNNDHEESSIFSTASELDGVSVSLLKFSPIIDGKCIALAVAQANEIFLLDIPSKGSLLNTLSGHSSEVVSFDFSIDGSILKSTGRELDIWDVKSGTRIKSSANCLDCNWDNWSSVVGWPVQGLVNPKNDRSRDVLDVVCCTRSQGCDIIAAADENKHIYLTHYPCLNPKYNKIYNSFGQVKKLQFSPNDDKLFAICSITDLSTCLCQYKCIHQESRKLSTSLTQKNPLVSKIESKINERRDDEEDMLQEAINEADDIRVESDNLKELTYHEEPSIDLDNQHHDKSQELLSENLNISNISMASNTHDIAISRNPSQFSLGQNNNYQNHLTTNHSTSKILSSHRASPAPSYSTLIQMAKKKSKKEKEKMDLPPPMTPQQIHAEISSLRSKISGVQKDKSVWKTKTLKSQQDLKNYTKDETLLLKAKAAPAPLLEFESDVLSTARSTVSISNPILDDELLQRLSQDKDQLEFIEEYKILRAEGAKINSKVAISRTNLEKICSSDSPDIDPKELKEFREKKIELGRQYTTEKTKIELLLFQQSKFENELMLSHKESQSSISIKKRQLENMKAELLMLRSDCSTLEELYASLKSKLPAAPTN